MFKKYNISYILYDHSLKLESVSTFKSEKIKKLLDTSSLFREVWHRDTLTVYAVNPASQASLISSASQLPNLSFLHTTILEDHAFQTYGPYISTTTEPIDVYYPFLSFQQQSYASLKPWHIEETDTTFTLSSVIPQQESLRLSHEITWEESVSIATETGVTQFILPVSITTTKDTISATFPKISLPLVNYTDPFDCRTTKPFSMPDGIHYAKEATKLTITSQYGYNACFGYHYNNAPLRYAYLLKTETKNYSGLPLTMHIVDTTNQHTVIQQQFNEYADQWYFLHSGPPDGIGFSINFLNFSYPYTVSKNSLQTPNVYFFPESILALSLTTPHVATKTATPPQPLQLKKQIGSYYYQIKAHPEKETVLIFNQSFDKGWHAYIIQNSESRIQNWFYRTFPFVFGKEIKNHVLVNNWANGWIMEEAEDEKTIIIFFLPQLLQWIGFALLPISFLFLFKKQPRSI